MYDASFNEVSEQSQADVRRALTEAGIDVDALPSRLHDRATELARALRVVARMSLSDAAVVETHLARWGGGTVVAGIPLEVAEHIAGELAAVGAKVTIAETSVRSPCRADPAASTRFVWGRLRQLQPA